MCRRILVIEDEQGIRDYLDTCLADAGYRVSCAAAGMDGLALFEQDGYDLILLDIMLPDIDGYEVCRRIRKVSEIPVIMLTAMGEELDEIRGFNALADDYITKPFSFPLLLKRIEAALRKSPLKVSGGNVLHYHDLSLDQAGYAVYLEDKQLILTGLEFRLLKLLIENVGKVLTREQIFRVVWKEAYYDGCEKIINHHVMNLRKKIERDYIETIRGVGYKIG